MDKTYLKDHMADTLKELTRKKSLSKITINDIVSECKISKQTFYNYFKDKNDLILYTCVLEGRRSLKETQRANLDFHASITFYYKKALTLKHYYRSFIHDPELQLMLINSVSATSVDYIKNQIAHYKAPTKLTPELEVIIQFNAAGNAKTFVDWIVSGMTTSPEVMAYANYMCFPEPLKKFFNYNEIAVII